MLPAFSQRDSLFYKQNKQFLTVNNINIDKLDTKIYNQNDLVILIDI